MKKLLLLWLFFVGTGGCCTYAQTQTLITNFGSNPGLINGYKYVPANMPANAPLVLVLHGCGQTSYSYSLETQWNDLADRHKFYVAYGEQTSTNNNLDCFNYYLSTDNSRGQGEALSLKQIIDYMKANYSIDTTRVFVTGLSAGGAMTAVMCACYPDVFAAGAEMSGLPYGCATSLYGADLACLGQVSNTPQVWGNYARAQNPGYTGNWPRMAIFQGSADATVNIENSTEMIKQWTNLHNCGQTPSYTNSSFNGNSLIQLEQFFDSTNRVPVEFYEVMNMAHGTAVYPGTCYQQGGAVDALAFDEQFYSPFWAAQFFDILQLPYNITGADSVTVNQQGLAYSVPNTVGSVYTWTVPAGVTIVSGQGTYAITVNWNGMSGTIYVTEVNTSGCELGPATLFVTATPVPQQPGTDAAVSNITVPRDSICTTSFTPVFMLSNAGTDTLTSVNITYAVDNSAAQIYAWTGTLLPNQSAAITLPLVNVAIGGHSLIIFSSAPNGGVDQHPANDTVRANFNTGLTPVINLGNDTSVCGENVTLNAGNTGYSFQWSTGDTTETISPTTTGTYHVTVTSGNNCSASAAVSVVINHVPVVSLELTPDTICENIVAVALTGGNPASGSFSGEYVNENTFNATSAAPGIYNIIYSFTDSNGCSANASENLSVDVCTQVKALDENVDMNIFPNPNSSGQMYIFINPFIPGLNVRIYDMSGGAVSSQYITNENSSLDISNLSQGIYVISLEGNGNTIRRKLVIQ